MSDYTFEIHRKFVPLLKIAERDEKYSKIDTVIITGGRYSFKSYTVAGLLSIFCINYNWKILFSRYTMESAEDSVISEVNEKIELFGFSKFVKQIKRRIVKIDSITDYNDENKLDNSITPQIVFKGIKTSSGNQTANLKSLKGFNCFVLDEAEEHPSYKGFKTIQRSIRRQDLPNVSILVLNPAPTTHWIHEEYFEKKNVEDGFNGVKNNICYIHMTYLDMIRFVPENILNDFNDAKINNPFDYEHNIMGGWLIDPEGVLLPKSQLKFEDLTNIPDDIIVFKFMMADPADVGGDKFSAPFIHVAVVEDKLVCYVKDVIHSTYGIEANTERIIEKLKENEIEQLFYESNGVGLAAILLIKKQLNEHQKLTSYNSTINKEVRILSDYEFVKKYFIFDSNYINNEEYKNFINDLCSYSIQGDNTHKKDAIDVLCSCANLVKYKYRKYLYGK